MLIFFMVKLVYFSDTSIFIRSLSGNPAFGDALKRIRIRKTQKKNKSGEKYRWDNHFEPTQRAYSGLVPASWGQAGWGGDGTGRVPGRVTPPPRDGPHTRSVSVAIGIYLLQLWIVRYDASTVAGPEPLFVGGAGSVGINRSIGNCNYAWKDPVVMAHSAQ